VSSQAAPGAQEAGFEGQVPPVTAIVTELVGSLALAAHAYMREGSADLASAGIAIDVASLAFERIKERLSADERLAVTQLLTETRLAYVRRRESR
jgi:uncharacterized membrane protein